MAIIDKAQAETVIAAYRPDLVVDSENLLDAHLEFASSVLNSYDWLGDRVSGSQTDSWPRSYVPIDKFNVSLGYRDSSTIPTEIQLIVAELAIRYYLNPGITSDSAAGIAVTGVSLPDSKFDLVGDYLRSRIRVFLSSNSRVVKVGG